MGHTGVVSRGLGERVAAWWKTIGLGTQHDGVDSGGNSARPHASANGASSAIPNVDAEGREEIDTPASRQISDADPSLTTGSNSTPRNFGLTWSFAAMRISRSLKDGMAATASSSRTGQYGRRATSKQAAALHGRTETASLTCTKSHSLVRINPARPATTERPSQGSNGQNNRSFDPRRSVHVALQ
jgi:hypothetical protein